MNNIPAYDEQEWKPAIYNGRSIKNLWVSNYGYMRRQTKAGGFGQITKGTPSFNRANKNRLRQYMVMVAFAETEEGQKPRTCVNLHRVICCTFQGVRFDIPGERMDVDHIDHNVSNAFVGTKEGGYRDGNLRAVTHKMNMRNRDVIKPRTDSRTPMAGEYAYRMKLELGCQTIADLPIAYRREYARIRYAELHPECEKKERTIAKPRSGTKTPIASEFAYEMKQKFGCRTTSELPPDVLREYNRIRYHEYAGNEVTPRPID